jgi:hypothetical protein
MSNCCVPFTQSPTITVPGGRSRLPLRRWPDGREEEDICRERERSREEGRRGEAATRRMHTGKAEKAFEEVSSFLQFVTIASQFLPLLHNRKVPKCAYFKKHKQNVEKA